MKPLARHVIAEYYGCDPFKLDDPDYLAPILEQAAEAAKATVIKTCLHQFNPQGVSGVVILAESHLAVHTWPEHGFAAVEVFTCGDDADPLAGHRFLLRELSPQHHKLQVLERGDPAKIGRYPAADGPRREVATDKTVSGFPHD